MKKIECKHEEDSLVYIPSPEEDGWECACGEKFGFRPDLDRKFIELKVRYILDEICNPFNVNEDNRRLLNIPSNEIESSRIIFNVVKKCRKKGMYDQQTIMKAILSDKHYINNPKIWKEEYKKFLKKMR